MARWQPGARERLQAAALERFAEQGFDGTTVAQIAAAAGLTERTFFRHFADKREVLFHGQDVFERTFLEGVDAAPDGDPMSIVAAALDSALRRRGVDATAAALTAETGVAVFRVAFAGWIAEGEERSLAELQRAVLAELRALVGSP